MGLDSQHVALVLTSVSLLARNKVTFGQVTLQTFIVTLGYLLIETLHLVELDSFDFPLGFFSRPSSPNVVSCLALLHRVHTDRESPTRRVEASGVRPGHYSGH